MLLRLTGPHASQVVPVIGQVEVGMRIALTLGGVQVQVVHQAVLFVQPVVDVGRYATTLMAPGAPAMA